MSGFDCPWWLRPLLWLRSLFGGIALLALAWLAAVARKLKDEVGR